jgi:hypothetical protein
VDKSSEIVKKMIYLVIQKTPIEPIAGISERADNNNDYSDSKFFHPLRLSFFPHGA